MPMRVMQWLQVQIQNRVLSRVLSSKHRPTAPFVIKLLRWVPLLQRIPARLIGIGIRSEHIRNEADRR